jgi:hypothetical protein
VVDKWGSLIAWLGALIMVLSIGFEAFVQQLIVYPSRNVVSASEPAVLRTSWIDSAAGEGRRGLIRAPAGPPKFLTSPSQLDY